MQIDLTAPPLLETSLPGVPLWKKGKVRDVYDLGDRLLVVATDRLSAFDVVLPDGNPRQGRPADADVALLVPAPRGRGAPSRPHGRRGGVPGRPRPLPRPARRALHGRRQDRGAPGRVCRPRIPRGFRLEGLPGERRGVRHRARGRASRVGPHRAPHLHAGDEGRDGARREHQLRDDGGRSWGASGRRRRVGPAWRSTPGPGRTPRREESSWPTRSSSSGSATGGSCWIDEALTPDSSRFWPRDGFAPGRSQPSFDKQFVRDYLESLRWNKQPPGPELPPEVVARTLAKYVEAFERLRGQAR